MSLLLTEEEMQGLTGYRQPVRQLRWLIRAGLRHYVRADGRPVVPRSALDGAPALGRRAVGPNLAAVKPPG